MENIGKEMSLLDLVYAFPASHPVILSQLLLQRHAFREAMYTQKNNQKFY